MNKNIKITNIFIILFIFATGCSNSPNTNVNNIKKGNLILIGENEIGLNGGLKITIQLQDSQNISEKIMLDVDIADKSITNLIKNNCINGLTSKKNQCELFFKGNKLGTSFIKIIATGYADIIKNISVVRDWGYIAKDINFFIDHVAILGNKIYVVTTDNTVLLSESNNEWNLIGDGEVYKKFISGNTNFIVTDKHICVKYYISVVGGGENHYISCLNNQGKWDLIRKSGLKEIDTGMYIEQDKLYTFAEYIEPNNIARIESFDLNNGSYWESHGEAINCQHFITTTSLSRELKIIQDGDDLYYLDKELKWKHFYTTASKIISHSIHTNSYGVYIMPLSFESDGKYFNEHLIYFNSDKNLNESFVTIGEKIPLKEHAFGVDNNFITINNKIYVSASDGNIYSSTNNDGIWSKWKKIGNNKFVLSNIYTDGKNLYSKIYNNHYGTAVGIAIYSLE